ncbi:exonuclease III [Rhizobium cellulosilyticum]|uniref:Exonuclease III n=1 Tax=Aliirhizobium cellulosilyticum TaxID=393664 RepID=A0A7W6WS02_9HYPH|nr:exonuclease III [Rhizobium cellulosilyticum]MBB4413855.1 exonuclease III [Rhizobium cellulosilyticum]MBB4448470.1 exonuclease III [Rhizobium cellulosilyticum]
MKILEPDVIALLVGDFNVMPTAPDVYKLERRIADTLYRPEVRQAYSHLIEQGWTGCDPPFASRRADLHTLEIFTQRSLFSSQPGFGYKRPGPQRNCLYLRLVEFFA